jgi:hypothetical protein
VKNIDPLKEEAFWVTEQLADAQGILKKVVQYNTEKLKTPITTQTTERILEQEE